MNDYLGSSGVGIHKNGPDTSSSQLGIKSIDIRMTCNSMLGTCIIAWLLELRHTNT